MSEIKVTVSNYGRKYLYMRYVDPVSGKTVAKSTGQTTMKEAVKVAGKWEAELQEGRYKPASKITWEEFRDRYESERLPALAPNTGSKIISVFNTVEELLGIDRLAKLDAAQISRLQRRMREDRNASESTIKGNLAHLLAALNWAKRMKLLNEVPAIDMPTRGQGGKVMKGRPITLEEFERMLSKVPEQFKQPEPSADDTTGKVARFRWFLSGLWFSGLRLSEGLDLSWDEPGHIQIDLSGAFPMFVIPGSKQKSGDDQILPIAPEFGEMLLSVPEAERTGRVFKIECCTPNGGPATLDVFSRVICELGRLAGVIVNQSPVKHASAHDFRRSFGERWSARVMPAVLQQMMRHKDITTTMRYYVGADGQKAAAEIHAAFQRHFGLRNTSSNTTPKQGEPKKEQSAETLESERVSD